MKQNLLIIGARGFGREVFTLAQSCINHGYDIEIKGFLDDDPKVLDGKKNYPPIISSVEKYVVSENDVFVCAMGEVKYKKKYIDMITTKGGRVISLIHPTVLISNNVTIGTGAILMAYTTIANDVTIGKNVTIQSKVSVGHDAVIGNNCHLSSFCFIGGNSTIGDDVQLYTRSTIVPKVKIGDNCKIGACSFVIKSINKNSTVFGIPAKKIKI